ncbi:fatty acid desaturase family protein [Tsuneonella sp. HG222]
MNTIAEGEPVFAPRTAKRVLSGTPDDKAMFKAAAELTRDIAAHKPAIYWADMLGSALTGYAALAGAILLRGWPAWASGVVAALLLYRALLFIHEISHFRKNEVPGFVFGWNALVGVPLLMPSLMYEAVHTLHHARTRYGTAEDPEYLPLALMKPWSLPLFVLVALLAPIGLVVRYALLAPLSAVIPALRRHVWERFSALQINPAFRRRPPEEQHRRSFFWQEVGASLWAIALLSSVVWLGWRPLLIALAVFSGVAVLNQLRTLVAHLWENEGEAMTVTGQYLDSVNVEPPLAAIWAPVGLRFHALHHLMPSLPYHALPEAHRRISNHLGAGSTYSQSIHPGMGPLVMRIARSTMRRTGG